MKREPLLSLLANYTAIDAEEEAMRTRMVNFIREHATCFERSLPIGHMTGAAWIVSSDRSAALMIHHRKLDKWLQPGGHADGDPELAAVAMKEAEEETGLQSLKLVSADIFDVDIHWIPDNPKEQGHYHYDVRFLLEADKDEMPVVMKETKDARWVELGEIAGLNPDRSIMRLVKKTIGNRAEAAV